MSHQTTNAKFALFPKWSIAVFSVLCTYFCGALMLGYNLRQIGKLKKAWIVVILHVFVFAIIRAGILPFRLGSILEYLIPNLIVGLLLAFPVWDYFLPEIENYNPKPLHVPIVATIIVWGGLLLFSMVFVK